MRFTQLPRVVPRAEVRVLRFRRANDPRIFPKAGVRFVIESVLGDALLHTRLGGGERLFEGVERAQVVGLVFLHVVEVVPNPDAVFACLFHSPPKTGIALGLKAVPIVPSCLTLVPPTAFY